VEGEEGGWVVVGGGGVSEWVGVGCVREGEMGTAGSVGDGVRSI
jgi:hypothetical protein